MDRDNGSFGGDLSRPLVTKGIVEEQRTRWQNGDRVAAETLLASHPSATRDTEAIVDVIHSEYTLRLQLGEHPTEGEYTTRFPSQAGSFKDRVALTLAMESVPATKSLFVRSSSLPTRTGMLRAVAAEDDVLPEDFGRYRIIARIGRGGMGAVYLAHDSKLDRRVAMKVPLLAERSSERFQREARIAANFTHPNLCPIFDVGEHQGFAYFTMPLIKGETLAARLSREKQLPEKDAAELIQKIARAVDVAHQAGVIHRDLKPANIMLDERGEPIVMDFGLARRDDPDDASTPFGIMLGTPSYIPPEQIESDSNEVLPTNDVYSLGAMLYHVLAGRPPYLGTMTEVLTQVREGKPKPPSAFRPGLDKQLERVCLRAMAHDVKARYQSMGEFANALEAARVEKAPRHVPWRYAAVIVATLVLLLGGWLLISWLNTNPASALTDGSVWRGVFTFEFSDGRHSSDVSLLVTRRQGNTFEGVYSTENEQYVWECQGEVRGSAIQWKLVRARKPDPHQAAGHADVKGEIHGDVMSPLTFENPGKGTAEMSMKRVR